jgi:WhiB family redox-sensing transcriptional regulator
MWKPAENLGWQSDAECGKPENKKFIDWFFSKNTQEKYAAKNMCFSCPVRAQCLQWALEHRQLHGIWGGKDEIEIRRTLSVSYLGEETRRRRFPNCPHCSARPSKLETSIVDLPKGGRWKTARVASCTECGFAWRSRTSVNAINAYKAEREEKAKKKIK